MVMISYFETNEISNTYVNLQTGKYLDLDRVNELKDNAMLKVKPELWIEWDFEKNNKNPYDMTKSSDYKAYWVGKCNHKWQAVVKNRNKGSGCPYCSGLYTTIENSIGITHPNICLEWDCEKNKNLKFNMWNVSKGSSKKAWWKCLKCDSSWESSIANRCLNKGCPYCSGVKVNHTNCLATKNPQLASEWHPTKNGDLTPYDVTWGSHKKVWWECTVHHDHEWIANIYTRSSMDCSCPYCSNKKVLKGFNDIHTTNKKLGSLLLNHDDGYKYTQGSTKCVDWKCDCCGEIIRNKQIGVVNYRGLYCPNCSDGVSYPEKFIYNLLKSLDLDFIKELTHTTFDWIGKDVRYDFYIPSLNTIIETHGLQHYEGGFETLGGRTLEEELTNDRYKYELVKDNDITHYIVIDCRESNMDYIKKSILNSDLSNLLNFSEVDWLKISLESEKSLVYIASELWNDGLTTFEITEKIKMSDVTVKNYLKKGVECGICLNYSKSHSNSRSINKHHESRNNELMVKTAKLWNDNMGVNEIAKEINLSEVSVRKYLKKAISNGLCFNYSLSESIRRNKKYVENNK